ncbi:MAG: pyridoxal-phosphate dependent enzyme [Candidatus Nanoarchaeia archaeon]|nr:pyridoxal-phosphate dependent enzyme [Candidatus Nanoarchaeia archaeon]
MEILVYDFNRNGRTHKSLGINEIVDDAIANGVETISMISSGNFIRTLLSEIRQRGLERRIQVVNLGNKPFGLDCLEVAIEEQRILRDSDEREEYVRERLVACGKVKDYTDFTPRAYALKAEEILESQPDYVSLGVGSGKLFLALRKVIEERGLSTRLIGILPKGENGVFNEDNIYSDEHGNLHYKKFSPKSLADKLVCPYTSFKDQILEARNHGHILIEVSNRDFKKANRRAKRRKLKAEISGSAGFVLEDPRIRRQYGISEDARVVLVNTGRGYDWEKIEARTRTRNFVYSGLAGLALAASLFVSSLIYQNIPSKEELNVADLDGNGVVSAEEMYHSHLMAGTYSWNEDPKSSQIKYNVLRENPWMDKKTLARIEIIKRDLEHDILGRYHEDYNRLRRILPDVKWHYLSDLSFNQLHYLSEVAQFEDNSNPEFYRGRLDRDRKLHEKGINVPIWDVNEVWERIENGRKTK